MKGKHVIQKNSQMQEQMTQNLEKKNVINSVIIKNLVIDGTSKVKPKKN